MKKTAAIILYPIVYLLDILIYLTSDVKFKDLREETNGFYDKIMER